MRKLKLSLTIGDPTNTDISEILEILTEFQNDLEDGEHGFRCFIVEEACVEELKEDILRGPKLEAWAIKHDSHGMYMDEVVFMLAGEKPESNKCWVRLPWLDGKGYEYK